MTVYAVALAILGFRLHGIDGKTTLQPLCTLVRG